MRRDNGAESGLEREKDIWIRHVWENRQDWAKLYVSKMNQEQQLHKLKFNFEIYIVYI